MELSRDINADGLVRAKLKRIYTGQIGVREKTGRNDGEQVERYLRYVHLDKGNAWCAAMVCWALGQACLDNPRSGWSPDLFPAPRLVWQRRRELQVALPGNKTGAMPQPGDVFGIWFPDKRRIAHCGFVDQWSGSWVITVEGNTNPRGSREGDGVYRRRRLAQSLYRVADWVGD